MSQSIVLGPDRPPPRPDAASAPFFEALQQQRLIVQACTTCGVRQLARRRCLACGERDLYWLEASGRGVLQSFAIVHANGNPQFNGGGPYNIAVVTLAEGPQLYANVVHIDPASLWIGMPVKAIYSVLASGAVAPLFEPA